MTKINTLFSMMDNWRQLPKYQLERRADLFFALYLPQALEMKLGVQIRDRLIPEFPVRKKTIDPINGTNQSVNIDYLAISRDGTTAFFIELKTDVASRRKEQDSYLVAAKDVGLTPLLNGILEIFRATKAKQKYFYLMEELESIGLLSIPIEMRSIMSDGNSRRANALSKDVRITSSVKDCTIVYLQPSGMSPDNITVTFDDFRSVVLQENDSLSHRFAESLKKWVDNPV